MQFNIEHNALSKIVGRKEKVIFKPSPSVLPCLASARLWHNQTACIHIHALHRTHLPVGRDSAAGDTPSTTLVGAVKAIVGTLLQVISSDLFMNGYKGAVLALLLTEMAPGCHVLLHSSSSFFVPTLLPHSTT